MDTEGGISCELDGELAKPAKRCAKYAAVPVFD
jgi:hypothetical protein